MTRYYVSFSSEFEKLQLMNSDALHSLEVRILLRLIVEGVIS